MKLPKFNDKANTLGPLRGVLYLLSVLFGFQGDWRVMARCVNCGRGTLYADMPIRLSQVDTPVVHFYARPPRDGAGSEGPTPPTERQIYRLLCKASAPPASTSTPSAACPWVSPLARRPKPPGAQTVSAALGTGGRGIGRQKGTGGCACVEKYHGKNSFGDCNAGDLWISEDRATLKTHLERANRVSPDRHDKQRGLGLGSRTAEDSSCSFSARNRGPPGPLRGRMLHRGPHAKTPHSSLIQPYRAAPPEQKAAPDPQIQRRPAPYSSLFGDREPA